MDREKVKQGLECCCEHIKGMNCDKCPYDKEQVEIGQINQCTSELAYDALALLKEQDEQKQKWLQAIADNQLAVSPTGYETEEGLAKRTGEWNGLQMAWDILTEGRRRKMRLIDADALADALYDKRKNYPQWVADVIGEMPTIDTDALLKEQEEKLAMMRMIYGTDATVVGELVRCKDCRWAEVSDNEHTWCDHVDHEFCHNNDWFCADGERKEGR